MPDLRIEAGAPRWPLGKGCEEVQLTGTGGDSDWISTVQNYLLLISDAA